MANSLFDPINPTELNRDNLPINGRKTNFLDNITPFTFDSPLSGERVDHFPERIRSGTRDQDFFVGEDREQKLALDQSTAELWGKGIWNTAVEAAVGTLEGAAMLPGIDWTLKQVGESETGYGNFLSDAMASVKEGMKSDIYQTTDSREGFAPWDGTWWASNSETLGTTLSLMIPAMGMTSAVGKLGKLAKASALRKGLVSAETLANNASLVKNVENASKILGQATVSRWTENTMEAQGTFDETYNELINNGVSEEVARSQAGVAASRAWNANWVNLAQDALQFATIGKTINSISARSAKTVAENAKGLGKKTLGLAGTMASESLEETGQYVIGQEAKKSVIDQNYRFSDIYSRVIDDYSKDPELHTSMFFGALGGGVFQGAGNIIEGRMQKRIQKDIEDNKQKINAVLNDDYVKETGIDTSLVFNKAMAYADMGVIDDLKDSVNKELSKSDEEFINEGKTQEEVQEYKTKLKDVLTDIDFISDVRMKADTGYKDPMAVRLQVASEYSLRNFGRKLNTVKADLGKLTSDSLAADGTVEAITRFNDINTIEALKAFKEQVSVPKEDGTYPVRNLEDVQFYIDERIKQVESEISTRLPEGKSIEQYLKKDKNSTFANSDAFKNNIAAQEELKIAMEDFKLELEIAKGNKTDILRERARKATLNNIKDQIRENKVSLSDIRNKISTIKDPDFKTFIDDTIKSQGSSSIPLGKDRNNDIISRYNGKTLLFAKEMDDMAEAGIDNISIDTVESFVAKYNNDAIFKNKVDAFYDTKAKQEGKFYDLTELRRETINDKEEVVTIDSNPVYQAFTSSDKIANSLEVALVKKINDDTVVFFGFNNSQEMPLSEFKKSYSTTYLYDEFTPLYRLDGSVVANDFNTFVNTKGETVTLISAEAHAMINDPSVDLKGKNVRYRVYSDHPQFSSERSPKGYLVGVEVEVESGRWLTMGRLPVGKDGDGLSVIREHILQKHRESGSDVIELGSKVTVKQNGFIKRKPTARNPYQTIAKKDDVLAVIIPVQQNEIGLVYGKISEELGADMRASTNSTKLARYAGNTVLMVKQSDGSYVPTKLRTKKVSEVTGMYERVEKLLEAFETKKGTHTTDDLDRLHAALHEMTFLVIERLPDGRYRQVITTQGGDVWSDPMTFAELKDDIKVHKAMRVDKDRINDKEYHREYLDKYEILTTDIVPHNRHVGASIAIDLVSNVVPSQEEKQATKAKVTRPVKQKPIDIPVVEDYEYISSDDIPSALNDIDENDLLNSILTSPKVEVKKETKVQDDKFDDLDDVEFYRTKESVHGKINTYIDKIYKKYPELSKIGNTYLYNEYIKTVFPDHSLNDNIAYHFSSQKLETFDSSFLGKNTSAPDTELGFFFSEENKIIPKLGKEKNEQLKKLGVNIVFDFSVENISLLNLKNPAYIKTTSEYLVNEYYNDTEVKQTKEDYKRLKEDLIKKGHDGIVYVLGYDVDEEGFTEIDTGYIVFDEKNIHILGSEKDKTLFLEFVKKRLLTESEKEWFAKYYPEYSPQVLDDLSTVSNKGGSELYGMFKNGVVYLSSDAATGTLRHEAFHLVFNSMLNDKERKDILAQQRYEKKLSKSKTDIDVEESLADDFMDVKLTGGEIINTFTGKIKDFFKRLWNIVQIILERNNLKGSPSIDQLFYRANRGLYNNFPKFQRNVTRFRKNVYGDLSMSEANMASQVIANNIVNAVVDRLRELYNMPDAETLDVLKKAAKLNDPKYKRKENEKDLKGYSFNDLLYLSYRNFNKTSQDPSITEAQKNSLIRVMNALGYVVEDKETKEKKFIARELKNLVVGQMQNHGIKADVSNLNETVAVDINSDEEGVPDDQADESFDFKDRFTSSLKDFRARTRQLFASIPNSSKKFATYTLYHDPATVYNTIKKHLESSLDQNDMMTRLESLYDLHPDYEIISDKFIKDETLAVEFYKNFAQRNNTSFIKIITDKDGTKTVLESNKTNITSDIRADWHENFLNTSNYLDNDTGKISDKGIQTATDNLAIIKKVVADNVNTRYLNEKDATTVTNLLYDAGIIMDANVIKKVLMTDPPKENQFEFGRYKMSKLLVGNNKARGLEYFYDSVSKGINPFRVSDDDAVKGSSIDMNKMMDNITYNISTMFPEMRSSIFQNGKGKSVDSNLLPRDSARRLLRIKDDVKNNDAETLLAMKSDPFWKDSKFINEIRKYADEMKLAIMDTSESGKGDHREYSELTAKNFHTSLMNLFFNFNKKGEENSYGWYGMPIPSDSTAYNIIRFAKYKTFEAEDLIVDTVNNERNRIKELEVLIAANEVEYNAWVKLDESERKYTRPEAFKDIPFNFLLNGRKYQTFSELNNGDKAIVFNDDIEFATAVNKAYKNYAQRVLQDLVDKNVIEKLDNGDYIIKDEDLNHRIGGTKVTKGDNTEIVNNPVKLLNNLNRFIAHSTLMNIQTAFLFAGDIAYYKHDKKTNGTSIEDFFKRVKQINSPGTYLDTTATFRPVEGEEIKVRKSYRVGVVQDRDDITSANLDTILAIQERYVRSLNYSESEITKHLDDIRFKYSVVNGKGGMNITDAFTVIDLYRYREIAVASAQWNNVKETLYQKIMNGDEVDPKEMEIMQPFKPFRYSIQNVAGKYVPIQHKNAEMLITPQMAKYNSVHRTAMEKMGYTFKENGTFTFDKEGRDANKYIDALMYNSSVKVGEMRTFATEEAIVPSETQLFANDDYRIQMGTPDHFIDSKINIGSQIRKLIMEGFDLTSDKTYSIGGKQMTGKQIVDMYNDIISKNLEESYQEVRDIFTDDKGNIDRNKMVSELKKYIIERELGTDYLEAVELINGSPTIPYWYPTIAYNLQAIFSAFYKNNITKQTASGMALFNSSSVGYMEGTALPKPKIVFKADGSSIEHIEALIPINNKRLLKYVDPKTGLVDVSLVEKQDPKLLKGLFYRIPSEDKYSMVHIKVVGYLPTSMGAQIILPDEITTMAGLDFDIDKMFGMMYETDNKGLTVASGMDSKAARNNIMLDLMYGIMQLPETAERQLSPGNFDNLKKIKNDVLNITGTDASLYFYSQASKAEVQQRNMMGNELIGTFANHRVNHIFFTLADFKLVEPIEFDGRSLSSLSETISPVDKKNIGQRLATFVAAVVDNAKDPIASMLNLTPFLSDVAALMIRVGHTDALVGRFLSQKVFVKLSQDYSNSSDFGAVAVIKLLTDMRNNLVVSDRQVEEAKTLSITMDVLKENLKNPNPVVDLALINKMLLMYEQADMLRKIMSTMRYDSTSKAAGPTYFETEAKIQESSRIIDDEKYIIGYKKFLSNDSLKWVRDFFTYGVVNANRDMLSILELPYRNEMFENLIGEKGYFNRWKLKGSLKPNELEIITRAIMTVNASSFRPFNNERSLDLMKTFPDRLQTFKNKYHQYSTLTALITVEQPKTLSTRYSVPFKTLKFNKMGITPSHMQTLRDMWTEMLESEDQTVRTFAQDLAAYSFFTSGFMFKKNSIAEAIPVTWMTQITHDGKTFIQHITEKNNSSDLNEIQKEEIVRNLYQSLDVFGTVKEKENGVEISMDKATGLYRGSVDMNVNRFYVDSYVNKEKVRTYSPYVRFQLSGDIRLLKLVSVNMDSNVATYEEIQPLGIHNRYVQFSDGSKTIKGVISAGVSRKKEDVKETVIPEKVTENIIPMIKENGQYEGLQYAIATFLSDQKTNEPMTTSETMDSFEAYSMNPVDMTKEEFNTLTMDQKLAHWFAYKNCK